MKILSDESVKQKPVSDPAKVPARLRAKWTLPVVVVLVLLGIPAYLFWSRLTRIDQQLSRLNKQVDQGSQRLNAVAAASDTALARASQAEQSALQVAQERDQAEKAKAQSEQEAEQARKQAQAAEQNATLAQQKAEQYRREREEELARLQQALGQIAETHKTAMGLVMTLGSKSIRFAFDQSSLRPEDREVLSRIAGVLSTLKGYEIYVYGYTDQIGTKEYNQSLSERRAQSVRDYLVQAGLNPAIISTKGFGESDPLIAGATPQARAINRRVEIGIVDSTIKPLNSQAP